MSTNYPGSPDTFNEPSQPESTPLNQGGNQTAPSRNHFEHHRDLGDAVEALQNYAALRSHDHSGTSDDRIKGGKLAQANTHQNADTDTSATAIHHTIGTGANQAAAGNHTHTYPTGSTYYSSGIGNAPWVACTSSTRPVGVPRGTVIYETDTNRVRVWAQFSADNVTILGINSTDTFDRTDLNSMGSGWQTVYTPGSAGKMGTNGNQLVWTDSGTDPARAVARRIDPTDAVTLTDNQIMTWRVETDLETSLPFTNSTTASNDMYFRMSADGTSYLRLVFTYDQWARGRISLYATKTGPGGEQELGSMAANTSMTDVYWVVELVDRTVTVRWGPSLDGATFVAGQISFPDGVANKGSSYRGWGIGMVAGNREGLAGLATGQVSPASLSMVNIQDSVTRTGQEIWQLLPVANVPTVRLAQEKNQSIEPSGSLIEWNVELEDNFAYFNPSNATNTKIKVSDAGVFHFDIGIQWGVSLMPETAVVVVCVNGQETLLRKSQVQLRPGLLSALGSNADKDLSPTISLSGKLRLAVGDEVTVKCRYGAGQFNTIMQTFFDINSRVKSRLEMRFLGP